MSRRESLTAVMIDKRRIEMRYFAVPELSSADGDSLNIA
jgi:hypothetical protein